jgi:hypothetical protein
MLSLNPYANEAEVSVLILLVTVLEAWVLQVAGVREWIP